MDGKGTEQWPNSYPNEGIFLEDITKKQLIVVEVEGKIVGMVCLSPDIPKEYENVKWNINKGKTNSVHRLAVHPFLKIKGIASILMSFVEEKARSEGFSQIRLDTYSKNILANRFYKKNGYNYCGDINLQYMPEKYFCYEKAL